MYQRGIDALVLRPPISVSVTGIQSTVQSHPTCHWRLPAIAKTDMKPGSDSLMLIVANVYHHPELMP